MIELPEKQEEVKIEEPKIEEVKIEESKVEETKIEESKVEELQQKKEEPKVEQVKIEEKKEISPTELIKMIKDRFGEYLHSKKVLIRAVKSCPIVQINQYLTKRLEEEPKWEAKWNIVYAILTNEELPKCKFCNKQLPYSTIEQGKFYCSEECEQTDINLKNSRIEPLVQETIQKTTSLIDKVKKFFKRK